MRVAVYTDYIYSRDEDGVYAERAFAVFLASLANRLGHLTILGRLDPVPARSHYRLPPSVDFVALPFYASVARPWRALTAWLASLGHFWRALDSIDVVWLLGPHPLSLAFWLLATLRRRPCVLGVRQDTVEYTRSRHPGRRGILAVAWGLESAYRAIARREAVIVVGPVLAEHYKSAARLLQIFVSLVGDEEIDSGERVRRSYDGDLLILSVGRLDEEKNPLLLADVLHTLAADDSRWRMIVCGEGPLRSQLEARLEQLGVADRAEVRGYVALDGGLLDLYRTSHFFLHISWTEGLPQVLWEAFAAGLPVVATAVGGVPATAEGRALLIGPGDSEAAAAALSRLASDESLRQASVEAARAAVRSHTLEAECGLVAEFLGDSIRPAEPLPRSG